DPASNLLSGFAWAENVGWINFNAGAAATPPSPARIDPATFRVRGAAWGENVGWINFDTTSTAVSFCRADFDGSGVRDVADIFAFLSAWFSTDARADYDYSGGVNVADIFVFLSIWFAGC
ncbi:MAG: hypothetical protein K2Q20_10210, partial [Phycisphaerales bacterium]|nr:hypothetical protein [Phycisphaerales bacterium]